MTYTTYLISYTNIDITLYTSNDLYCTSYECAYVRTPSCCYKYEITRALGISLYRAGGRLFSMWLCRKGPTRRTENNYSSDRQSPIGITRTGSEKSPYFCWPNTRTNRPCALFYEPLIRQDGICTRSNCRSDGGSGDACYRNRSFGNDTSEHYPN